MGVVFIVTAVAVGMCVMGATAVGAFLAIASELDQEILLDAE
jgi:hypothetical protein